MLATGAVMAGTHQSASMLPTMLSQFSALQAENNALENQFYSAFGGEIDTRENLFEVEIAGQTKSVVARDRNELSAELKKIYNQFVAGE